MHGISLERANRKESILLFKRADAHKSSCISFAFDNIQSCKSENDAT